MAIAFNGHAHIYQRNTAPPGGVISYVTADETGRSFDVQTYAFSPRRGGT